MEIANFVQHGSQKITPQEAERFRQRLPALKVKVEELNVPEFPKLRRRLRLLADLFEDVLDGVYTSLPYTAFAEALFALSYLLKDNDIIPDSVPGIGMADDASIVSAVFLRNEAALIQYSATKNLPWSDFSSDEE